MKQVIAIAKAIAMQQGYHTPMLLVSGTEDGGAIAFEQFPGEHEERVKAMWLAGKQLAAQRTVGTLQKVFFVSEGWLTRLKKDEPYIRPAYHPNRIEVLLISCLDVLKNEQTMEPFEYVRDQNGKLTDLKPYPLPAGAKAQSPLLPAFVAGYRSGS